MLMSTLVPLRTEVVKHRYRCLVDDRTQRPQILKVADTLGKRLQWVLDHRKERVGNQSQWALAANLDRSNVRVCIARNGSMRAEAVAALARVAGVSVEWLASGKGTPDDVPQMRAEDEYPARAIAIASAKNEALFSERAVAAAQGFLGEGFRFWTAPQWGELIAKLTLAEARHDPELFHRLMAAAREKAANEHAAAGSGAPSSRKPLAIGQK
jgi:hypothetical protein